MAPPEDEAANWEDQEGEVTDMAEAYRQLARADQAATALEAEADRYNAKVDALLDILEGRAQPAEAAPAAEDRPRPAASEDQAQPAASEHRTPPASTSSSTTAMASSAVFTPIYSEVGSARDQGKRADHREKQA